MEWVAIDVNIAGNTVTHLLADQHRLRVAEAVGLLALTFAGMAQHAEDGLLDTITDSQIEEWARWHGKRGAFASFFRAEFCNEDGLVRGWEAYNGAHIKKANEARQRMADYRKRKAEATEPPTNSSPKVTQPFANRSRTVHEQTANGSSTVRSDSTGHNSTRERTTLSPTLSVAEGAGKGVAFDEPLKARADEPGEAYAAAWRERYGSDMRKGRGRAILVGLERDHDDVLARWRRYLAATSIEDATATRFAKSFGEWAANGAPVVGSPRSRENEHDEALARWRLYREHGLLTQYPRNYYVSIGEELVAAGKYPSVDAFMREVFALEPWTLNTTRISEEQAIAVVAKRLRVFRRTEATLA